MAILDKISLETRFQLNTTPNEIIRIDDTTDYTSEGIALADVIGVLVIKSPLGVTFHSTTLPAFDIDLNIQTYIDTIALPTDANGDVLKGTYEVAYTIRVTGAIQPGDYTKTFLYDYCYDEVDVNVGITVDLINATLTSTDNTSYPVELTNNTRTHTIYPPAGLSAALFPTQVVSTAINVYGPGIATKTWTGQVSNILELTFAAQGVFSEHIIDATVVGDTEKTIVDDVNICNLQCNMRALTARYAHALQYNPIDAKYIADDQLTPALINAFMYTSNIQCGNFENAEFYYNEVLKFTGSSPDCACIDGDTPTLITASGGGGGSSNTYVVAVCGTNSALTVTPNTVGDETTYTVCFDDTVWTKINALTETIITSVDATVTVTPSLNGYTKTWDLSVNITPATSPVHSFSGILDIDLTNKTGLPTMVWETNWDTLVGDKLQKPTITNTQGVFATYQSQPNCFYLEDYIDQAGGQYPKPQFQIAQIIEASGFGSVGNGCSDLRNIKVVILDLDTGNDRIYFKITDSFGSPLSGATLTESYDNIKLSVIINA